MKSGYITIQSWMRTELNLKGNDLLVYAIIYGFSQTENQRFTGSLQYIADWCGATKQGVLKNLQNLIDAGLIAKEEKYVNNIKLVEYYSTEFNTHSTQFNTHSTEFNTPIKLSLTNNIDNTLIDNIEKNTNTNVLVPIIKDKPKTKSKNLYDKCLDIINEFTDNETVRKLLQTYLRFRLEVKDKPLYSNQFKGMLNKLKELTDTIEDMEPIIQQSIDKGYLAFYPLHNVTKDRTIKQSTCESNVKSIRMSEEDKRKQEEFLARMKKEGKQIEF